MVLRSMHIHLHTYTRIIIWKENCMVRLNLRLNCEAHALVKAVYSIGSWKWTRRYHQLFRPVSICQNWRKKSRSKRFLFISFSLSNISFTQINKNHAKFTYSILMASPVSLRFILRITSTTGSISTLDWINKYGLNYIIDDETNACTLFFSFKNTVKQKIIQ